MPADYSKLIELTNSVVNDYSKEFVTWSLSLLGGSILLILGTDHIKPPSKTFRLIYFIFFPAWYCLVICIHDYTKMKNASFDLNITSKIQSQLNICRDINNLYAHQINYFFYSIIFLSIWLCLYLIWWIFFSEKNK